MGDLNKFGPVYKALSRTLNKDRAQSITLEATERVFGSMFQLMMAVAPEGKIEPRGPFGQPNERASERLFGGTLDQYFSNSLGSNSRVRKTKPPNVRMEIGIDHPSYDDGPFGIIEWLTEGTEARDDIVPLRAEVLAFWWFEPKDGESGNARWFPQVDHPGTDPDPWLDAAINTSLDEGEKTIFEAYEEVAFGELRKMFNG